MSDVKSPRSFGPAAAALVAAGLGTIALGLLAVVAQIAPDALAFSPKVGPLSGEGVIASAVFFGSWKVLAFAWRSRNPSERVVFRTSAALILAGLILTLPPVYRLF